MIICLLAANDGLKDPRARAMRYVLDRSRHDVRMVTAGSPAEATVSVKESGRMAKFVNRRLSKQDREERLTTRLAEAAIASGATIFVPTDPRALRAAMIAARQTGGTVSRTPKMSSAGDVDLIDLAPRNASLASPVSGLGINHTLEDDRELYAPPALRHSGIKITLCYRRSEINPGRYLQTAFLRAGVDLRVETESIDLGSVEDGTTAVVFVEGPYPALDVTGATDVPTLFWAHHGEHHLYANVRLADRYQADAVLLAHSWHLAFWFPAPVHRFPFGFDPVLLHPDRRLSERRYDVAMVGAGISKGGQYSRRQELVKKLREELPANRLGFKEQVSAEEMAALYSESRIVINDGGTRHFPITMRVMESVGSGAMLLSDRLPGMDLLLEADHHYRTIGGDVIADVDSILNDLSTAQSDVDDALNWAQGRHTYDHRVDELLEIASQTRKRNIVAEHPMSTLAAVIDRDVETQRIAHLNAAELESELPSREVWDATQLTPERLAPNKMEAIALRTARPADHESLMRSARRYMYIESDGDISEYLERERPESRLTDVDGIKRVDTMAPSYRIMGFERTET